MNQGKLDVVKQEMIRINTNILGNSELKWTGMADFISDDHYIYYCGQEFHRRNGVALIINKKFWNTVLGCNLKNDRMISVHFQGKSLNITVIQVYAPNTNAKEAEVDQFYEDLGRRQWQPNPVILPGKSHGRRSLVGCSPQGREESDTTEWLHFHVSLSWIGEGNGNPLPCSCLENPRDGRAWGAAIHEIAQSWTWLKRLSSSSSIVRWMNLDPLILDDVSQKIIIVY